MLAPKERLDFIMKRRARRHFAGKPPKAEESTSDEDSSDSDSVEKPKADRTLKSSLTSNNSPSRRPRIKAKVLDTTGELNATSAEKKTRRRRIEAKVLSADGSGGETKVKESVTSNSRSLSDIKQLASEDREVSQLSGFKPVDELEMESDEEKLPELNVKNESSDSSSGEDSSSESNDSESSDNSSKMRIDSPGRTQEKSSRPNVAPIYVPNEARICTDHQAGTIQERRIREKNERERTVREETLRAARHTIEETEYDLKHVDMSQFPDDTDRPEDYEEEYALWRVRELKRVMSERGITIDDNDQEEFEEETDTKPNNNEGTKTNVGAFFAEKGPDGRYVEEIFNRDFGGQEAESARLNKK